jgi:hypothetical protein
MSETPRTDKEIVGELLVFASFARKLERELSAVTEQRDRLAEAMIPAMTRAYTRGYNHGHADTVESAFMIVHANDELEVFADDILQMLLDGSQPEAQSALAAAKGGDS